MKNLKKLLALLLTVSMLTGLLGTAAFAADPETTPVAEPENQEEVVPGTVEKEEASSGETGAENAANALPAPAAVEPEPEQTEAQKLQAAIDAATDGEETTITMTADIEDMTSAEIITIPAGKVIVLDMAGHSITVTESFAGRPIANKGTLTVTGNGTIDSSASRSGYGAIRNDGTLTIENGTYIGNVYGDGAAIRNGIGSTLTVNDGYFAATGAIYNVGKATIYKGEFVALACSGCGTPWAYALNNRDENGASGKMDILPEQDEDVKVHGTQGALASVGGAEVYVQGGTFYTEPCANNHTGSTFYALYVSGKAGMPAKCVVDGGIFSTTGGNACVYVENNNASDNGGEPGKGILEIHGGTFDQGDKAKLFVFNKNYGSQLAIDGGTFSDDVTEYVVPSAIYDSETGTVNARTADDEGTVAEVGGKYYASLRDAINAVTADQTVTLLKDVTTDAAIIVGKNLTLDLGGKTLTTTNAGTTGAITVAGGKTTVNNGKIVSPFIGVYVQNPGNFELAADAEILLNGTGNGTGIFIRNFSQLGNVGTVVTVRGKISGSPNSAIQGNGNDKDVIGTINIESTAYLEGGNVAIYHPENSTLNINGGTIIGKGGSAIATKAGELNITGGTIQCTGEYKAPTAPFGNGALASGAAIQIETNTAYAGNIKVNISGDAKIISDNGNAIYQYGKENEISQLTSVKIAGGTFSSGNGVATVVTEKAAVTNKLFAITGGTFSTDVDEYCADTSMAELLEDGHYHVVSRTPSVLSTDIGEKTFLVGSKPVEFTFTTVANSDAGRMVIGTSNFSDAAAIEKLEYYEVRDGQWYELSGDFGSGAGFPMSNATSKFRVTFNIAGIYTFTASMKLAETGKELCSTEVRFAVYDANSVATIGNVGYPTLDAAFDALNAMPGSETVTMTILPGIHTPQATRKLLVTRDNVVIQGAGQYETMIDCKAIDVDGQAGVYIGANNVTLKDMTITTSGAKLDAVKVSYTNAAETQPLLTGIVLENLMLNSATGNGLNLHGVDGVTVTNVEATGGKCGLSLANAKNVTVRDSALEGKWGSVGMMYKAENPNGTYNNPVELTLAGANRLTGMIYSERPAHADTVTLATAQTADIYGAKVANSEQLTTTLSAKIVDSEGKAAYYATLPAAVADAQAGDTVTLLQSVTITEQLLIAKSDITLDGNGKTITADGAFHGIQVYCADNVTLKDLTVTGAGKSGLLVNASSVNVEGKLNLTGNGWDGLLNVGYGENITGTHSTSLTFAENATLTGVTTVYSDAGDVSRAGENTITIGSVPGLVQVKGSADMPNCWTTAANAEAAAEAKTGDTYYAALQAAVDAAAAGDTVTLLQDVTLDAPMGNPAYTSAILITKNLTLDGNGKTIAVEGEFHGIQVSGNVAVTIKDLTVTGAGKDALLVNNGSNVTVDGLTTSDNAWGAINVDHGSTLDFQSGSLSESTKIWTEDFENCHITAAGLVEVHDLPNEDGKVHFLPETDARVIAKVGSVYYGSLAEAVAVADDGDTVTMVNDASGAGIIVNKSITIDFGGKTYTVAGDPVGSAGTETLGFQLLAGANKSNPNTVTMSNGTIVLPSDNADLRMGIQNYSNLTLDGMTLDASGNSNITYVLSNNNGSTRITGGTVLKAAEGQVAFDVYDYSSNGYGDVSVAVDNATVSGKIEVSDSEKASLTITGGTYTVDVNAYCATGYVAPLANGTYTVKLRGAHSELTTNIGELEFVTGNAVEFTFTTKANGDAGVMVLGTSNFSEEAAIAKLEYKAGDQWLEYPRGGDFGPSTGFPMSNATSTFRVTFAKAGNYSFTASMKTVAGGKELCSTTVSFTVDAAVAKVGNTYYKSLTDAAASEESGAITLLADTSLNAPLTLDRDLILNADLRLDTGAQLALNGAVSGTGKLRLATEGGAPLTSSTSIKDYVASGIELTEGVEIIENRPAEGGYSYQLLAPVAQVGGVVYDSLQEAIDAAADGATVKLLVGTSLTNRASIPAGKTLTLDLGEKTLSAASGKDVLTSAGNLTITNGTISAQGRDAAAICANAGSVTLAANAKLTGYYGVYSEGAALTVNGEIEATNRAVYLKNAAATVGEGAQLSSSANGSYVFELSTNTTLNITGGTVRTGNGVIGSETSVVNVTGGTFASRSDHYFDGIAAENLTVTGGSFASDVGKYLSRDYLTLFENNMYTVTQGTLTIGQSSASLYPNDTVTLTVTPANAGGLTWTSGNAAVATVNNDGIVTAVAVGEATITATISNGSSVSCTVTVQNRPTPVIPGGGGGGGSTEIEDPDVPLAGVLPFEDVEETDWFYDGVYNVYFKDLMVGVSDTLFDPHGAITRGMIVSILYRLEGSPAVSGDAGFDDVPAGQWYTDGVTWAASHKIVEGYGDGSFQPNKSITREEFAAILYRYAGYKGYDTAVEESAVLNFTDAEDVSQYAVKALLWAVKHEMLNGMGDGTLAARSGATRAQAALIFTDFCSRFVDEAEEK